MSVVYGFGSPGDLGTPSPYFDWGFGDPPPSIWGGTPPDFGFGDPDGIFAPLVLAQAGVTHYPDNGGSRINIQGPWPVHGPFRVRLLDAFTAAPFPPTSKMPGCYGGPGLLSAAQTDSRRRVLSFYTPPLPPGLYDIEITWNPGGIVLLPKALRIVYRSRYPEVYALRKTFGNVFKTGPKDGRVEPWL